MPKLNRPPETRSSVTIERAVVMCDDDSIGAELLPGHGAEATLEMGMLVPGITLEELERLAILQALEAASGSTAKAAEMLGVSRRKVQYRLKEWGLTGVWTHDNAHDSVHDAEPEPVREAAR